MDRRTFLAGFGSALVGGVALNGRTRWELNRAETSQVGRGPTVDVETVADGFTQPIGFATVPEAGIRYVADKMGQIYVHDDENGVQDEPLLDISDQLKELTTWEQGLLGFELHPEFASNRRYFVRYSSPRRPGTPDDFNHTFVLSEFTATEDFRGTVPDSERAILEIPEPGDNHNSGAIVFGPDDYLYVAVGDGQSTVGDKGRGHANDWYLLNGGGNGQNLTANLRGSILRIDVDRREDGKAYRVPDDNPLVGKTGLDEQYAWGFRNPFRMSFDGEDLYVGDVGEGRFEEVNRVVPAGNYGWNVRVGTHCFSNRLPVQALAKLPGFERSYPFCPSTTSSGEPLVDPVVCYPHNRDGRDFGVAVIGGYVYRNGTVPELRDQYVFGDLMGRGGGGLYTTSPAENEDEDGLWRMNELQVASTESGTLERSVLSFGRDHEGELYVMTSMFGEGTGELLKIVPAE